MTNGNLMKVESIAECSPWSILQYIWPALRDNSWKQFFGLFESDRFTQVLITVFNTACALIMADMVVLIFWLVTLVLLCKNCHSEDTYLWYQGQAVQMDCLSVP